MGWIGVDLDATLAEYHGWDANKIGAPIPSMLARVKAWLAQGWEVRIFTARAAHFREGEREEIEKWLVEHVGRVLPITATKDFTMIELWDDRAIQVIPNTGRRVDGKE